MNKHVIALACAALLATTQSKPALAANIKLYDLVKQLAIHMQALPEKCTLDLSNPQTHTKTSTLSPQPLAIHVTCDQTIVFQWLQDKQNNDHFELMTYRFWQDFWRRYLLDLGMVDCGYQHDVTSFCCQ